MENLKLTSIRMEPETLRKIDEMAKRYDYYTRSSIINNLLSALLKCATGGTLWRMLSEYHSYEKGYVVKFEKDRAVLEERSKVTYDD